MIVIMADLIFDYVRNVSSNATDLVMVVYNVYLFLWGALCGLILVRYFRKKKSRISGSGGGGIVF